MDYSQHLGLVLPASLKSPPPPSGYNIPPELLLHIVEFIYYNTDDSRTIDRATLSACSLVHSSWTYIAREFLFHSVHPRPSLMISSNLTIPLSIQPFMQNTVRRLEVAISSRISSQAAIPVPFFIRLLSACSSLYELALEVVNLHAFSESELDSLRGLATREEQPLKIVALNLVECGVQSPILFQLLSIWPTIKFLRIGSEIAARIPLGLPPTSAQIYELTFSRNLPLKTIEWLLSSSKGHLRILEFRDPPENSFDSAVLSVHGSSLHSLRIFRHTLRLMSMVRLCPNLRELIIMQISPYITMPLAQFPEGIEHFSFRDPDWGANETLSPVLLFVGNFPKLRVISCDRHVRNHAEFGELEKACREKGVELITDLPSRVFVSGLFLYNCKC